MLWVVQNNLYNEYGYKDFLNALDRLGSNYTIVKPVPFSDIILPPDFDSMTQEIEDVKEPYIDTNQKIVICGALTLGRIAQSRGWAPGTFLNENFDFVKWRDGFGRENLLNGDSVVTSVKDAECVHEYVFLRPTRDTKAFTGAVMSKDEFCRWKESIMSVAEQDFCPLHRDTPIMMSPAKKILAEYRMFIVDGKIVTGSVYRQGTMGISHLNKLNGVLMPDESVISMTQRMIDRWQPADAFVIDIAKTHDGLKVIEINNFNSSGFYSCDVYKIVDAIERLIDG